VSKVSGVGPDVARLSQEPATDGSCTDEAPKSLSPAVIDWMRRFQEAGIKLANDEEARKAIAKRLF